MGRLAHSWSLFKTSFGVIKQDKELLWMPVLSFVASIVAIGGVVGVGFSAGLFAFATQSEAVIEGTFYVVSFLLYVLLAFVQVYFHAATVSGANERLAGGDPTVGSCLRAANKHLGRLFLWSLVVATVNVILQIIRERSPAIGRIIAGILGTAWNLATYFVVPILIFEHKGIGEGLKGSGSYFKKTWGESIAGEVGIGFVGGVVSFAIIAVTLILAFLLVGSLGIVAALVVVGLGVLALIVSTIVFTVAAAVYKTALYRFASSGEAGGPFDSRTLAAQWHPV